MMTVRANESGGASQRQLPTEVSEASSLDSFLMDLPPDSDFAHALQMNCDEFDNETTEGEDFPNGSSNSLPGYDCMTFSAQGFDFNAGESMSSLHDGLQAPAAMPPVMPTVGRRSSAPASTSPSSVAVNNSVPEFLYQLHKMLTDSNAEVIEWSTGRIEVHSPQKLESHVLKKYFRHSKFASFQRQLNYFGFRKLAGKGKMAPCSYINDAAMDDITSLFHIKRKSGTDPLDNPSKKKRDTAARAVKSEDATAVNPVLAGIYNRSSRAQKKQAPSASAGHVAGQALATTARAALGTTVSNTSTETWGVLGAHQALARRAVGKGIRHGFGGPAVAVPPQTATTTAKLPPSSSAADTLSALASNYQNSLLNSNNDNEGLESDDDPTPLSQMQGRSGTYYDTPAAYSGFLSRNSSLVDLAMIAPVDEGLDDFLTETADAARGFGFVDFPNPEVHPSPKSYTEGKQD